jgi:hypothetical protein
MQSSQKGRRSHRRKRQRGRDSGYTYQSHDAQKQSSNRWGLQQRMAVDVSLRRFDVKSSHRVTDCNIYVSKRTEGSSTMRSFQGCLTRNLKRGLTRDYGAECDAIESPDSPSSGGVHQQDPEEGHNLHNRGTPLASPTSEDAGESKRRMRSTALYSLPDRKASRP